jgi:hypothetical protein
MHEYMGMDESMEGDDENLVQIKTPNHHDNDTDDIVLEQSPDYETDKNHSKFWNALVQKKSEEIENQMQMIDNDEQAKIDAQKSAEENAQQILDQK